MSCGVRRCSIDSLSPDVSNALVIGVVIAKQSAKRFVSKTGKGVFVGFGQF